MVFTQAAERRQNLLKLREKRRAPWDKLLSVVLAPLWIPLVIGIGVFLSIAIFLESCRRRDRP